MILYLPVLLFLVVVPQMNEGLELPRSIVFIIFCLTYLVINPKYIFVEKKILLLPALVPIIYLVNIFFNEQNILQALFGAFKRNFGIFTLLATALLFLISINSRLINSDKLFKISFLPLIGLSIAYAFIQITGNDVFAWGETERVLLTLGNSNFAAAYIAILLPGSLYGLTQGMRKNKFLQKVMYLAIFLILIYLGLQTKSFQFNVLAITVSTTYFFIFYYDKFINLSNKVRITGTSLLILISSGLIFINRLILNDFTSADDRLSTQLIGLKIFQDNFFTGVGVENTASFAQLYISPRDVRREGFDRYLDKSHNSIIDHFANGGIFIGLSYSIFFIVIFYFIYRLLKANVKLKEELALLGSIFSGYVIQLFFNTDSILIMILPYIAMGMITKLYLESLEQNLEKKSVASSTRQSYSGNLLISTRLVTSLLILIFLIFSQRIVTIDLEYRQILAGNISNGDEILKTLNGWPYARPTEQVMVELAQNLDNCAFLEDVTSRLLIVNQRSSEAWFVKAVCADFRGDLNLALRHTQKAINLHPLNVRYLDVKYQLETGLNLDTEAGKTLEIITQIGVSNDFR